MINQIAIFLDKLFQNQVFFISRNKNLSFDKEIYEFFNILPAYFGLFAQCESLQAYLPAISKTQVLSHVHKAYNKFLHPIKFL
jgi:hypothetical protein